MNAFLSTIKRLRSITISISDEDILVHWGKPFDEMIQHLYRKSDTLENMKALNQSLYKDYRKEIQEDTHDLIAQLLAQNIHVGVVTAANTHQAVEDLEYFGVPIDRFCFIQGAEQTPVHKPHPDVFLPMFEKLSRHGVEKSHIAYVGDALHDHAAARDAGIDFIAVTTGLVSKERFQEAGAKTIIERLGLMKGLI
jgi:HAD superfamily hydrolase (TIGR01549 family)